MKKIMSILLASLMLISCFSVVSFAEGKVYEQPFAKGTEDCEKFRIPSIITLNDGSVLAAADLRYNHGADSPGNLDTVVAVSKDGYTGWETQRVNYFDDYAHGYSDSNSASFIDPVMVQDSKGTIYLITDAFPSGGGAWVGAKGTGHIKFLGKDYLALTNTDDIEKGIDKFEFFIGDFVGNFAPVIERKTQNITAYTVDREYKLYKNGSPLYMKQVGSDKEVQQSVFYVGSELTVQRVMHLWLRTSTDGGKTWSHPSIITSQVKQAKEGFFGVGPGKGFVTTLEDGTERIIFCVYDNSTTGLVGVENASTIYSDDGGKTWHRGERVLNNITMGKTSESQIVSLPDGTLRMYSRNDSNLIGYADSTDGGVTWTTSNPDRSLEGTKNCMVSFINYSKQIENKDVIVASYASNIDSRADGVVRVGLVENDNSVSWKNVYHLNQGFFAYSCLTVLSDGNIGVLGEDGEASIKYTVLSVSDSGELTEINGNNAEFAAPSKSIWDTIKGILRTILKVIQGWFGLI